MDRLRFGLAALLLISSGAFAQPRVGELFPSGSVEILSIYKGWEYRGSGITRDSNFSIFRKGNQTLVAVGKVTKKTAKGGILETRITDIKIVAPNDNEIEADSCGLLGEMPAIAFRNPETGLNRGYFAYDGVTEVTWYSTDGSCESHEEH